MKRSVFFKTIAVLNFIVLFTIFLLYRNGLFDNYFYKDNNNTFTSHNGGVSAKRVVDSVQSRIDSIHRSQRIRLSSSKSLVVIDNLDGNPIADSTHVRPTAKEKEIMQRPKPGMMYSSKSGMIVEPNMFVLDSLLKEKEKQKKQQ